MSYKNDRRTKWFYQELEDSSYKPSNLLTMILVTGTLLKRSLLYPAGSHSL